MTSPSPDSVLTTIDTLMMNDHAGLLALREVLLDIPPLREIGSVHGPLFISASFLVDRSAATPYLPIPAAVDPEYGPFRIAPADSASLESFQRALLNGSRSQQVDDDPIQGVLSWCHRSGQPWHTGMEVPDGVLSTADADQKHLARHLLFFPIRTSSSSGRVDAVLLLLSTHEDFNPDVASHLAPLLATSRRLVDWSRAELRRLREGDATRGQLLTYLKHIEAFLKDRGQEGQRAWKEIAHELDPVLKNGQSSSTPLDQILARLLDPHKYPLSLCEVDESATVSVKSPGNQPPSLRFVDGIPQSCLDCFSALRCNDGLFAELLINEALASVANHGSVVRHVRIRSSHRYCCVHLDLSPGGTQPSLPEYFAIRRGLFVPRKDGAGLGIGLALFGRMAHKRGAFRTLYVSPKGDDWHIQIAFPLE